MRKPSPSERLSHIGVLAVTVLGLYASSFHSYLLFHSLIEIITVAVAFTLFILTWNTRSYLENGYLRLLGIGYGLIALIDLVHTLAYKGMEIFPGYGANLPTQLWIAARYLQAITLVAAPLFVQRRLNDYAAGVTYVAAVSTLVGMIYAGSFPDCYIEGVGLTAFKVDSEYLITAILLAAMYLLYRKRDHFDGRVFALIAASIGCTAISEISFTAYVSVYGLANLMGHFAKLVAFYLIYRAVLVTGLRLPFDLIFRDLKQAEDGLRKAQGTLEERVLERTAELRASQERLQSLIRKVQAAVVLYDGQGRILSSNPFAQQLLGLSADQLLGKEPIDQEWHFLREDGTVLPAAEYPAGRVISSGQSLKGQLTGIRHPERNDIAWVLASAEPEYNEAGELELVIVSFVDITERTKLEAERLSVSRYARSLIEASLDPLVTISADGKITDVNEATVQATGVARDALVGKDFSEFFTEPEKARAGYEEVFAKGLVTDYPLTLRHVSGKLTEVLYNASIYRNEKGDVAGVFAAARDITERARLEEERLAEQKRHAQHLEEIAHHDSLTGLPNRLLLSDRLHQAIAQTLRAGTRIAVCYLDLDGFKEVNDRLGHEAGDQVLVEVANRLMACVRGGDTVARLGGDEFVVLLSGLADDEECRMALERLLQTLLMPYLVAGGSEGRISASIGVTVFPSDRADADTLVRHADHAMYAAKQAGKGRYQMFDIRLEQRIEARHATLRGLADALQSGQFRLHYQPKVDCRRGSVVGVEALIRWQHPTLGLLSPAEFVPLIEDTDLAPQVGEWVILEALSRIGRWRREGVDIAVSVNAFVRQLLQPGFAERLGLLLEQYPEAAEDRLQIEIVETAALKELDAIRQVIEDCRKLGVAFSLDDFGTGYSTLAHLRHLPVTEIKIDQSFVGQMLIRPEDLVIVEAVIGLSRAFDRSVVAEGAETPAHIVRLLELGCDVMQGYALARPMIGDDIPRWVHEFRPDPAWYPPANGVGKV